MTPSGSASSHTEREVISDRFVEFWSQYQPDLREAELAHDWMCVRNAMHASSTFRRWWSSIAGVTAMS